MGDPVLDVVEQFPFHVGVSHHTVRQLDDRLDFLAHLLVRNPDDGDFDVVVARTRRVIGVPRGRGLGRVV